MNTQEMQGYSYSDYNRSQNAKQGILKMDYTEKLRWSKELAERVKRDYNPWAVLVAYTSGGDSNIALRLATMFFDVTAAFTCDTTIASPETLTNCQNVADRHYGLKYICKAPPYNGLPENKDTYFEVVKQHGFPGKTKTAHSWMYRWLKAHTITGIVSSFRQRRRNRPIVIISGARKYESVRRMGTSVDISVIDSVIWVNICNEWTDSECYAFQKDNNLDRLRSPISRAMGISGECWCGAFAPENQQKELKIFSPSVYEKLQEIHKWLLQHTTMHWNWESGPPKSRLMEKKGQLNFFNPQHMIMCSTCMNNTSVEV